MITAMTTFSATAQAMDGRSRATDANAQSADVPAKPGSYQPHEARDGRHDFDFEIGTWQTKLRRLGKPLSGSTTWLEYQGTSTVRKVWDGRANLVELDVEGPAGSIEGLSLRLYNPESGQWSLNFANARNGTMTEPVFGEFRDGRGEFYGRDTLDGRAILVRFVISPAPADTWQFEQAFSDDGGKSWEVNWIAIDTRIDGGPPVKMHRE
jgi:hypothetical protein